METKDLQNGWEVDINFPLQGRKLKPRDIGLTMMLDKGLGLRQTEDLLELAADYIDFHKLSFGTSALYQPEILQKKIELVTSYGIDIYPGGTYLEIAVTQGKLEQYLTRAKELGFTAVEVSDGTIELTSNLRSAIIRQAAEYDFKVLSEVGKKDKNKKFRLSKIVKKLKQDIDDGAYKVIIEARESGKGISIYDEEGDIDEFKMEQLLLGAYDQGDIIWEAPLKKQQVMFINTLGPNVNLGNISPDEILALESLRVGVRGDTFKTALLQEDKRIGVESK
ncbi:MULTISPECIES: phosphosulfolactate synthase [unclassified Candidatus Frackibacter]|uniref:phosphosulfolactate synthase n=1 Tax=unclassified Candidatus Frackibacter TaxID=2648818 RepID=UPI0008914B4E|nr:MULTISPECIES: phosphosulfolactate synthase [unclassified Candidatus Frackibacter]SDC61517.1 phosphosulfolactate synthase [Candidatus Frackibacter sp. WG11]SEM75333.1 phosphosulfolactate synthase [Candidatus Frackibacter sp. WG12]SFL86917.1 phosphosulfolactate synthase [Candidatus Frackibacter sp. WG13]